MKVIFTKLFIGFISLLVSIPIIYTQTMTAGLDPHYIFRKDKKGIHINDYLGRIKFQGASRGIGDGAQIIAKVTGIPNNKIIPTKLGFLTGDDKLTEKLTILGNGNIEIHEGDLNVIKGQISSLGDITTNVGNLNVINGMISAEEDIITKNGNLIVEEKDVIVEKGDLNVDIGNANVAGDVISGDDIIAGGDGRISGNAIIENRLFVGTDPVMGPHSAYINGSVLCTELNVETYANWPDFVFEQDYTVPDLTELENFIKKNKHLPDIPSAIQVKEEGFSVAEMQARMLQKIEELYIIVIDMQKEIGVLENNKGK